MENQRICDVEGCKANMKHRKGAHSNWCPRFEEKGRIAENKDIEGRDYPVPRL